LGLELDEKEVTMVSGRHLGKCVCAFAVLSLLGLWAGCGVRPDEKSGGDEERHKAKPLKVGESQSDSVDYKGGDRTDWKVIELEDAGILTIEVVLDNPKTNVSVVLFDRFGRQVSKVVHTKEDENPLIRLIADCGAGRHFVRIQAGHESDKTGYTINAKVR
jgi:hypothetical protein